MSETIPYPKEQQIHSLSFLSNPAFMMSMPTNEDLQNYTNTVVPAVLADATVQSCIGTDWKQVWGPVVQSDAAAGVSPVKADIAMGLFYSPGQKLFVVSVSGTNPNSTYDWLDEDFDLNTTVSWQTILSANCAPIPAAFTGAGISAGMNNGLQRMLVLTDSTSQTMLVALQNYLTNNQISGAEVAVAGHSLGGGLTPVVALYMQNIQQDTTLNWNTGNAVTTISAWPTAGPTPGEANFAGYYESLVNTTSFTYCSKYNNIDVVPQSWLLANMETVPTIYDGNIKPTASTIMAPLIAGAMVATVDSNNMKGIAYTPISPAGSPRIALTGSFNTAIDSNLTNLISIFTEAGTPSGSSLAPAAAPFSSFIRFMVQMAFQHTFEYEGGSVTINMGIFGPQTFTVIGLLGIDTFTERYNAVKAAQPNGKTSSDVHQEAMDKMLSRYLKR